MEIEEIELNENELLEAIKTSGLNKSFQAYLQKSGDRRLSEGLKTYQANQGKKNLTDSEKIANLENELKEMRNGKAKENTKTLIEAELVKQNLSKGLSKYVKTDSDDPSEIEKSVTALSDDLLKIEQDKNDLKLKEGTAPLTGEKTGAGSLLENYIKNANEGKNNSPFEGKISKTEGEKE